MGLVESRIGLGPLRPGTLNVLLPAPYIVSPDALIQAYEYPLFREVIKLQRCRIGRIRAVIVRPSTHELGKAHGPAYLELAAKVNLRDCLRLADGDEITVEVGGDARWWRGW